MTRPEEEKIYSRIAIDSMVNDSVTDFDLYVKGPNGLLLYGAAGYKWHKKELVDLKALGYRYFYHRNSETSQVFMYYSLNRLPRIDQELPPPQRIKAIEHIGADYTKCLYHSDFLTPSAIDRSISLAQAAVNCLSEDRSVIHNMKDLSRHDEYTYFHGIRVSLYAIAIANNLGINDTEAKIALASGALLHDIGKKCISKTILEKPTQLSHEERNALREHPRIGFNLVKDTKIGYIGREIILHHHEKPNGSGYPDGLDRNSILPEAQIVSLADSFDALTSTRFHEVRRSKFDALSLIKHQVIEKLIPWEIYRALVNSIAP